MDIISQVEHINKMVKESYCTHDFLTPLDATTSKIGDISFPVTCDDCGKILECEHEEIEHTELPYCTTCGNTVIDEDSYYGYRGVQ